MVITEQPELSAEVLLAPCESRALHPLSLQVLGSLNWMCDLEGVTQALWVPVSSPSTGKYTTVSIKQA